MKKFISLFAVSALIISQVNFVAAEDSLTVKHSVIKSQEDFCSINVAVPHFEGFSAANQINASITEQVTASVEQARSNASATKELNENLISKGEKPIPFKITLDTTYDYIKNGDILSVQFNTYYYSGGAHPTNWVNTYTANTKTGELYKLGSLFKDNSDYSSFLTNNIIEAIAKKPDYYFKEYAKTITDKNGDYSFYIDGDKLIIYFGLYDIAPYAAGIRRFVFDAEDLKPYLKDEVYNSIKDAKPSGAIRYNGTEVNTDKKCILTNNGIMVPLRVVAETLGYTVEWNENDGAMVAGGSIKEGENSYTANGKQPVSLAAATVLDGVTYVPFQYFKNVLEENVSYYGMNYTYISDTDDKNCSESVIKIFSKAGF